MPHLPVEPAEERVPDERAVVAEVVDAPLVLLQRHPLLQQCPL